MKKRSYLTISEEKGAGGQMRREFHIASAVRKQYGFDQNLYQLSGNVIFANVQAVREFCQLINQQREAQVAWLASEVNAMGLIDEINHYLVRMYCQQHDKMLWTKFLNHLDSSYGTSKRQKMISLFAKSFEPLAVYKQEMTVDEYLAQEIGGESGWHVEMEELWMLYLANMNPAFAPYMELFNDELLRDNCIYLPSIAALRSYLQQGFSYGPEGETLFELLEKPAKLFPYSLQKQLEYMQRYWSKHFNLEGVFSHKLVKGLFFLKDEAFNPVYHDVHGASAKEVHVYQRNWHEPEAFTDDQEWMPKVVMIAKNALVWLGQLTRQYGYPIRRLDEIPDAELERLANAGINSLWLIGIWQRSYASKRIKQIMGNMDAAASAYSLEDNVIADDLGGWQALVELRERAWRHGVRLASDMVPNHTGMDSAWVAEHPDYFLYRYDVPYNYKFTGENLTQREGLELYLEDGYFSKQDAAVVFKRVDKNSGDVRYIYHGNDGTMMPWNDTAQIDFLNPQAREAVIQEILKMAHNFSVIRLDAAMVLVKKHIQRLWYPSFHGGGDFIPSRGEYAMSDEQFDRLMPVEFWREVIDRIAQERPQTLLIAEAFWMLEGYFVRSLGMHRVYNSAFMHMLMQEDNVKYRDFIKKTITFDMGILKRFVNFMSNPDEKTAIEQFGSGDKYIGVATLMTTLPGLPMFAHGQLEGFSEKYGMEFVRAQRDEEPDMNLWMRHEREIFPLLHRRALFSDSKNFRLYDALWREQDVKSVFAYSNRHEESYSLVIYNNIYERVQGTLSWSSEYKDKSSGNMRKEHLADALGLHKGEHDYVIFQEQRSGLWYIRACRELASFGFNFMLDGYESQVFWNFHQVYDSHGQYRELSGELAGRGTPYNLQYTHPASFQLEHEVSELFSQLLPITQQHWHAFDQAVQAEVRETKVLDVCVDEQVNYLQRIATICQSSDAIEQFANEAGVDSLAQEYEQLVTFDKLLTAKAREFYAEDDRVIRFLHYYFWLKQLHAAGVEQEVLMSEVIKDSLRCWWQEEEPLAFALFHQMALLLVDKLKVPFTDRENLDKWWTQIVQQELFLRSAGVNTFEDQVYFHEQSMALVLKLVLGVSYFEQLVHKKLTGVGARLNLLQQYKRWLTQMAASEYNFERFTQLIID